MRNAWLNWTRFLNSHPGSPAPKRVQEMRKASLSSCLVPSFGAQHRIESTSLLPLLYETRTILSPPKTARHSHAANSNLYSYDRRRRAFCSSARGQAYSNRVRRPDEDPINFVDLHRKRTADAPSPIEPQKQNQQSRPSTVTKSEQAVFDRLLEDVEGPTTTEQDREDVLDEDELIDGYDTNIDLDSIFEAAIRELQMQEEESKKTATRNILLGSILSRTRAISTLDSEGEEPLSASLFKRPLKLSDGTTLGKEVENEDERMRLEVACDDHRNLVMGMLDNANSDVEIWQVLETEVFSLIINLDQHIKLVRRATKLHAAKARKAKAKGKDVADVQLEKGDLNKNEILKDKLTRTETIPIDNLVAILQRNYAEYCLHALRLLRRKHPISSYGPQVLSTIKRHGPISYVLGVTTDIYNEALFLQWTQYADLHGMADTIEEMLNQGIEGNEVTIALIRGIAKQRRMGRSLLSAPAVKRWWTMRGPVEGWRRLLHLFERITSELAERVALSVDEGENENEEMETDGE